MSSIRLLRAALLPLRCQLLSLDTRLLSACFFALLSPSLLKSDCLPGPYPLAYFCLLSATEFCWFFQCDQPHSSHHPPPPSAVSPHQLSPRSCHELLLGCPCSRLFSRFKVIPEALSPASAKPPGGTPPITPPPSFRNVRGTHRWCSFVHSTAVGWC